MILMEGTVPPVVVMMAMLGWCCDFRDAGV